MLVLVVVMVNSAVLLGMFSSLHLQVAESKARQQTAVRQSVEEAATEQALAILLKDPSFSGDLKFKLPNAPSDVFAISVRPDGKDTQLTIHIYSNGTEHISLRTFSGADLEKRRKAIGM